MQENNTFLKHPKIQDLFSKKTFWQVFRYGTVTLLGFGFLAGGIWLFLQITPLSENILYAILLTAWYIILFNINKRFVFRAHDLETKSAAVRFFILLILSWVLNNIVFYIVTIPLGIHYGFAVIITTIVLGGFRFLTNKYYVYRS